MTIKHLISDIQNALKILKETPEKASITSFKNQKQEGAKLLITGSVKRLLEETKGNTEAHAVALQLSNSSYSEMPKFLDKLADIAAEETQAPMKHSVKLPPMPFDIKDEINADVNEVHKCIANGCYRSSVILCGRIMETALHRKYFDATGNDLLEKAPGTGLGNLIAKLAEKGVELDPGLPNQIHLINQVRIFSVHKKQTPFTPSKTQAEAIYLYTMDILEKLFKA